MDLIMEEFVFLVQSDIHTGNGEGVYGGEDNYERIQIAAHHAGSI